MSRQSRKGESSEVCTEGGVGSGRAPAGVRGRGQGCGLRFLWLLQKVTCKVLAHPRGTSKQQSFMHTALPTARLTNAHRRGWVRT